MPKKHASPRVHADKPASPLRRIFARGHEKTGYRPSTGNLLLQFSEQDHRRIAQLIAKWLEDEDNTKL
ncbi:hypothetical protein OCL06_07160 [Alteromonas sp. ASW11-19]|uniref:Transcriptional regulator n=1 Tax=Alteromonas salexigens TaxID=2982530 RepID=A0ABT2VM28_9ALTE|nr:hypothetical protein [Alteromonas salexigens]MCU7554373.1 hypothetical protein [Alteromonas salexigens]